jgi:hypothetical protein
MKWSGKRREEIDRALARKTPDELIDILFLFVGNISLVPSCDTSRRMGN